MAFWDNWGDLLPGLLPASYRGVPFHVVNSDHEVGRRILLTYFPGIDDPAIDDFGSYSGPINVRGLLIGDDYIAQALALEAACKLPGIGTLLHPWLGLKSVQMEQPARISFSDRELRIAWFDASFTPVVSSPLGPIVDTAALVMSGAGAVVSAAADYVGAALGVSMAVGPLAQAQSAALGVASIVASKVGAAPEAVGLVPLVTPAVELVDAVITGAA